MKKKKINLQIYIVIALLLFIAVLSYFYYQKYYGESFQQALKSETDDICATPPDYTDEQWKEHMSHHPERYQKCF